VNILCCGRIKQGKTTLAIFLGHMHSDGVIVWDPRHMMRGWIVRDPITENLEDAIQEKRYHKQPIVIWPSGELEEEFDEVCGVLFGPPERFAGNGKDSGGFAFVVDEAADLQTANSIKDSLRIAVKQHPRSVIVIQCTHSLQEWNRSSKDTMSHLYCFRLQGRSLKYAVEYSDVDDDEELEQVLRSLPEHAYVHVDFEASPGAPAFEVCEPLPKAAVESIQRGEKPRFREYKEAFDGEANRTTEVRTK
jgi:muconolactone delta-isomerase